MFSTAGLVDPNTLGGAWTWEAEIAAAKAITKDRNGDGTPDQYGVDQWIDLWRWNQTVHQAGGDIFDRPVNPQKATFLTPAVEVGLSHFIRHWSEGLTPMPDKARATFWEGKSGMTFGDGPGAMGIIKNASWKWGLAPQPKGPANNGSIVVHDGFQITKASKNPDLAWEWLKFIMRPDSQIEFMAKTGEIASTRSVIGKWMDTTRAAFGVESIKYMGVILNNTANRGEPVVTGGNDLRWTVAGQIVYDVVMGGLPLRAGLEELQRRSTQFIAEQQARKK